MPPELLFTLILSAAAAVNIVVLFFSVKENKIKGDDSLNKFSVAVAAKNEEHSVTSLLKSFEQIDYPKDHFEIIIADDNSSDSTFEMISGYPNKTIDLKCIKVSSKKFEGKKGALYEAIAAASHPFIITTDADCIVPSTWLKSVNGCFNAGYDCVIGITVFFQKSGLLNKIISFENLRSRILMISASKAGIHYSASGGNFAFKKELFFNLNGYEGITQTPGGDDDLLLREAVKNRSGIIINTDKGSIVKTSAKNSFAEFVQQKSRHTATSNFYLLSRKIFLSIWHGANILALLSIAGIFISPLFIIPPVIKILCDIITVKLNEKRLGYKFSWLSIPFLQIIYEIMLIPLYISATFRKVKWK